MSTMFMPRYNQLVDFLKAFEAQLTGDTKTALQNAVANMEIPIDLNRSSYTVEELDLDIHAESQVQYMQLTDEGKVEIPCSCGNKYVYDSREELPTTQTELDDNKKTPIVSDNTLCETVPENSTMRPPVEEEDNDSGLR